MPAIRERGLSGKARRAGKRRRAARIHQQQLIEEAIHPEPSPHEHTKSIPIGSRSEFLPSACHENSVVNVSPKRSGGLVAVRRAQPGDMHKKQRTFWFKRNSRQGSAKNMGSQEPNFVPQPKTPTLRTRLARGSNIGWVREFSLRRFVTGCAVGSAAASGLLLLVQTLVG